ncbi:MAG: CHAT domain-containing tetratricopeptide repeat protein [Ginsengibacter sp.]
MRTFALVSIFSLSACFSVHAQNLRVSDSLRLDSLSNVMFDYNDSQKFDSAIMLANEVASLTLTLYDSSRQYAVSLNNVGFLYGQNFDYSNAQAYYKKALLVLEKYVSSNDSDYAAFINNLATLYDNLGNYSAAEPLYKESASIRKRIFGDTSIIYAESLNNLGNFYIREQNYDAAKVNLQKSISIRQRVKNELYAQTLNTLALVIQKIGNYSLAETKYKEALSVIVSCCGTEINEYWDIKNNLASFYYDMGNYKQAETIHKEVLSHILRKFHKKILDYGTTLGLLARDYNTSGEYDSALVYLKEESGILLKELTNEHPDYAVNLSLIASTYEKKNELDSANRFYNRVLEIRRKNTGSLSLDYAETVNDIGRIEMKRKAFKNAGNNFKEAANIRLSILGKDHPAYAESVNNLLELYYSSNNYKQWANLLSHVIDTWKNSTMRLLLSFGEGQKQTYLDHHLSQRDHFLSMLWYFNKLQNTDSLYGSYFKMVTALQGWLLSGSQELNNIINQKKDTSLLSAYAKWLAVKNQYSRVIQLSKKQQKELHVNVDSLSLTAGDLEKSIIDKLPELQELLNNTAVSPAKVAAKLKTNEVLVNWVVFRYKGPENWTDSILYAAFIISAKDTIPKFITAFEQNHLKTLLTSYFNYSGRGIVVKPPKAKKSIGADLYNLVWRPLLPYIKDADKVFIIPSGLLNKISFQSLEDTLHKTLLETIEVHLLNNTSELNKPNSLEESKKNVSLFGGANFDSTTTGKTADFGTSQGWPYLKGTADEVNLLNNLFTKNKWKTNLYAGIAASEENLKALSGNQSPEILHIATHGFYIPPAKTGSNANTDQDQTDYPLLRSGFLLSGANVFWNRIDTFSTKHEDGIVTAQEIANLNFSNTKLLTLSACQTALGDINNNEGVFGLQRAFKIAGVKEMLITLWQIPDKETKELMGHFYQYVFEGRSYYDALREAQLFMKGKYPDPAVWAGFELIGE